jgi:hypothetical protein
VSSTSRTGARCQADRVETDVVGQRLAAGGEQHLVDLEVAAVVELQRHRSRAAGAAQLGDGDDDAHIHSGSPKP